MIKKPFFLKGVQIASLILLLIANVVLLRFILDLDLFHQEQDLQIQIAECKPSELSIYGFDSKYYQFLHGKIKSGQLLPEVFSQYGFDQDEIVNITKNIQEYLNLRTLKSGNPYTFISTNDCYTPDFFIYQLNDFQYVVSNLRDGGCARLEEKYAEQIEESVVGVIEISLWHALKEQGVSLNLIDQMEDALASSMNFHQVQKGNTFKLIFNRVWVEGNPTNSGNLLAAYFNTSNQKHYAISFEHKAKTEFYDLLGRPMKKSFLKAPVRFSRISSPFSHRRFHPVLKFSRPHLGTDFAAPHGTPIMAVAAGTVEAACYGGGNGKYVKIKHDKVYQTQYLHMSRFAAGIRPGSYVNQGQTIGYVGSTGLATGPHVCFRFWKNGTQVNPKNLNFPSPDPLPKEILKEYFIQRDAIVKKLDGLQFSTAYQDSKKPSVKS
ncbi:MAG: peptidoglycan DD-metalloendopeptidase family protein [Bacteroidota bacterium]|nr:peptidoglycan DD-metalloendopeptidase family protein [Bacteroidota bacterium]